MAKIERSTQEIFANQAGSRQITAFGTAKSETPTFTKELSEIQNTNYLHGWAQAILPDKAPFEEDMNALFYAITKQLAYIFQEGIPEYDPNTEYSQNALARGVDSNVIYSSVVANNLGNDLADTNYWVPFITGGTLANYEIGKPEITLSNTLLPNEIWLEGGKVTKSLYPKIAAIYGNTYAPSTAADIDTYLYLPDFRNRAIWGASDFGYLNAGLPNITGEWSATTEESQAPLTPTGAFYAVRRWGDGADGTKGAFWRVGFNAAFSNPIYGESTTVQPPAIKVRVKTRYY